MRVVTDAHLRRFERSCADVGAMAARARGAAEAAGVEFTLLAQGHNFAYAATAEVKAFARAHFVMLNAGAELEIAVAGFLGERRWPGEGVAQYLERILALRTDPCTVLATQRANGLKYRP